MTSEEIKERRQNMNSAAVALTPEDEFQSALCLWLAEIAYQLAKRNEGEGCQ